MAERDFHTKLKCAGDQGDALRNYIYRDSGLDTIHNFCKTEDGKVVKQQDKTSFIKETTFSVSYVDDCDGDGSYTVNYDLRVKYLTQTFDGCDTDTVLYKHDGSMKDSDNWLFELHPTWFDSVLCYPENIQKNYITDVNHATVTQGMAQDAMNVFCDRSGDGQQYTLDPP
ncbi:hypothetical protein F4678DRAFT_482890 [Xylaria arbuscula]|nr:hypothetical protein F4678DRAFT_482890 [Xylaria arbuscula]